MTCFNGLHETHYTESQVVGMLEWAAFKDWFGGKTQRCPDCDAHLVERLDVRDYINGQQRLFA